MDKLTKEQKQDLIQKAARKAWNDNGEWGLLAMATGTGKSKCAVDETKRLYSDTMVQLRQKQLNFNNTGISALNILLVVPTEKLRDTNWEAEFKKWNADSEYKMLERTCYASLHTYNNELFDLVIFDEAHNLTDRNSIFFSKNSVKRVLALSATPPDPKGTETDKEKVELFKQFRLKTDFYYPLEQARADGLVSDYELWVVETTLDDTVKYIQAGSKAKGYFMQTEKQRYEFLSRQIKNLMIAKKFQVATMMASNRKRLIGSSIAKKDVIQRLINRFGTNNRTLVFGGGIEQIEELLGDNVYHSKSGKKGSQKLLDFQEGRLDILGCVDALNEGINIPNLDIGIIGQLSSVARVLIQRIGRLIRYREGHKAIIFIVIATGTQDEEWFKTATADMDQSLIKYVHAKNI